MNEIISTANARCPEGWKLFWVIGDYYTIEIIKEPNARNWSDHKSAVEIHKDHINECQTCDFGIQRIQIQLNELAVEDAP